MRLNTISSHLLAATLGVSALFMAAAVHADPSLSRGEVVYRLAGCENCHTDREHGGARLAGGRKLSTPLGTFFTPNITPDPVTGIGKWHEADLKRALRQGKDPQGRHYYPSFPYTSYTRLSDEDISALWGYLRTVPAVHQVNKQHDLPWYLSFRQPIAVWKLFYFKAGQYKPNPGKSAEWNRGAYLVQGAGHCSECHTPRNRLGGFKTGQFLAGTRDGPDGCLVPNITPDRRFGIGSWKAGDISDYLASGNRPDGDLAGGLMAEVIDNGLNHLPREDINAIAAYLQEQPPVANPVSRKQQRKAHGESDY